MFFWIFYLSLIFMCLPAFSAQFSNLQESCWIDAYQAELRANKPQALAALFRLSEYHRMGFIQLSDSQLKSINRRVAALQPIQTSPQPTVAPSPIAKRVRRPKTDLMAEKHAAPAKRDPRLVATAVAKAQKAYEQGRLEESVRLYRVALRLSPDSNEAKAGLERALAEMN